MKRTALLLTLAVLLLLATRALAMSSDNYHLDWFVPLTGGGGGAANSVHYAANFTVGQAATGASDSTHYDGCLGYWCGAELGSRVYIPLVLMNYSSP
jgi:hypothetical protein